MQPINSNPAATSQPPAEISTAAISQASTSSVQAEPDPEQLQAYTMASITLIESTAALHRAEEAQARALANAHRMDPFLSQAERVILANCADHRADGAAERAEHQQQRADALRAEFALSIEPMAVIVITVQRDRIQQTARLMLGGARSVSRTWDRSSANAWRSRDPEWSEREGRIGVELVEYMDAISLPSRVANMLPRPAKAAALRPHREAAEVANG